MAKMLFYEVFSAVLNSKIGIIMKKKLQAIVFSLLGGCYRYRTPLHGKQGSSIQNPSLNCYGNGKCKTLKFLDHCNPVQRSTGVDREIHVMKTGSL